MKSIPTSSYASLRKAVERTLLLGQRQVEQAKVQTYWKTGKLINEHVAEAKSRDEHYGTQVIERLSEDLGISASLLARCARFARSFNILAARPKSAPVLSWAHYRELITVRDEESRLELMKRAEKSEWTYRQLSHKIQEEFGDDEAGPDGKAKGSQPLPARLIPKRGTLYTYRLIAPEKDSRLWIDLGFGAYRDAGESKSFKAGQIVESAKKERLYVLKKSERREKDLFTYRARVERVVDGDTLRVDVDLGFGTFVRQYLRLRGIDAPERDTPEGKRAKEFVQRELGGTDGIEISSTRDDKYGRYLADVFYGSGGGTYLNQKLLDEGQAARYE